MSAKFLFVGGGTGGHLAPALGLAESLVARGHRCRFLTSGRAVERDFLRPGMEHAPLGVEGGRLHRRLALFPALGRAWQEARRFRPDLVVGLGGWTGAAALAARRRRPLVLLEGNRVLGRGVRALLPFAKTTLTLFPEVATSLARGTWVGPIGRHALRSRDPDQARQELGLRAEGPVLLVTGGSQGAEQLNQIVIHLLPRLANEGVQLLALCGKGKGKGLRAAVQKGTCLAVVLDHCSEMGAAYSAADFALCRGGAATMAELWLHHLPAAIVPYAGHADRQQERNARALEPGVWLADPWNSLAADRLLRCLLDPGERQTMADSLAVSAPAEGGSRAATLLEELAHVSS